MYETIIISIFAVSWSMDRLNYYCYYYNDKSEAILNLNTPLITNPEAKYYPMNSSPDINNSNNSNKKNLNINTSVL